MDESTPFVFQGKGFPLPEAFREAVRSLYLANVPPGEIARRLGCQPHHVRTVVLFYKLPRQKPSYNLTEEQRGAILRRAREGATAPEIGREFNLLPSTIRKMARHAGIELAAAPNHALKLSANRIDAFMDAFANGEKMMDAIAAAGMGAPQFYEWIKSGREGFNPLCADLVQRLDAFLDGRNPHSIGARKYALNEHYFDRIDTEEKAWLLGFIATDGCVSGSALRIKLASTDRVILETINSLLESDSPILDRPAKKEAQIWVNPATGRVNHIQGGPSSELSVTSIRLAESLRRLGITPRKTYTIEPWMGPAHLMPHYYRGVIDGDGCIGTCKSKGPPVRLDWRVSLVGTEAMAAGFQRFVQGCVLGAKGCLSRRENVWIVSFSGNRLAKKVLRVLYGNAAISLPRKLVIARECLDSPDSGIRDWSHLTQIQLDALKGSFRFWAAVARHLGMSRQVLTDIRKRLRRKGHGD